MFRGESEPIAGVVRNVAIKRIHQQSEDAIRLLVEEARIWVQLQHPNIVTVVDFGEEDGDWFLALELVDGMSASILVERVGPLPVQLALCIGERVARALGHAHAHKDDQGRSSKVIHRDVKPANILLSRQGAVKITDFGIARGTFRQTQTTAGMVKGSCGYFSPEQARGEELDARSDLFSLGCSLFELLTGHTPVPDSREEALRAAAAGRIERPPDSLPAPVRELLLALLAPSRLDRPSNADEVARRIRALIAPDDPDDLALELGRLVSKALDTGGVTPEDAPSLVPTKRSDSIGIEKTRISKLPPVREPEKTPPAKRTPSRTVPAMERPAPPPPFFEERTAPKFPAEPTAVAPPTPTDPAAGGFPFRDLLLPVAGISVALGAVLAAVIPTRHHKPATIVDSGVPLPAPSETTHFLVDLMASPTPPPATAVETLAPLPDLVRARALFREAKARPEDADRLHDAFQTLATLTDAAPHADRAVARDMARDLGAELVSRHPADSRTASVRRWLDSH